MNNKPAKIRAFAKILFLLFFSGSLVYGAGHFSLDEAVVLLQSYGPWAIVISIFLNVLISLAGLLPSVFLSGANALVFGLIWGGVISWLGEIIGAGLSFLFYRYFLQDSVATLAGQTASYRFLQEIGGAKGFQAVIIARLLPMVPSGLVNLVSAVSPISFFPFLLATALGKIPSLLMETFIGHDLFRWQENWPRLFFFLSLTAVIYYFTKRNIHN